MSTHPNPLLLDSLQLTVPLLQQKLRGLPEDTMRQLLDRALASRGLDYADDLMFGGGRCGESFAAFAEVLAVMSLTAWGGVTFAGVHWCTTPGCPRVDAGHEQPYPWSPPPKPAPRPVADMPLPAGEVS
ncbi:hypothetical protein GCM10010400_75600 [Streptomyces aculeolatus]|uniref:hypothetical protein n=1 Tax=Streptomyces aculeolatus TaxID=270689 RepID=UPI001CECC6B4|nr:hypothetical protein [Streptomyces aculeolatus]